MANRFVSPEQQFFNFAGQPYAGGQLFFYISGTSTPTPTYQDEGLTTPNSNPVVLDSAGNAGNIFLNPSILYKVVLEDSNNNVVWTFDPVIPTDAPTSTAVNAIISCTANGTNAITLTPINASQQPSAYSNYTVFAFVPAVTTTGLVSAQVGSLAFFPVFLTNGSQAAANDFVAGNGPYFIAYGSVVAGATPGFLLLNQTASSTTTSITIATTVSNIHNNKILQLAGGAFFTLTFPSGASLSPSFSCTIVNEETAPIGKGIAGLGTANNGSNWLLYPGQSYRVFNDGGTLRIGGGTLQRYKVNSIQLFCDANLGSDDPTIADGLASGARAYQTQAGLKTALYTNFDHNGSQPTCTLTGQFLESITFGGQPVGATVVFWNGSSSGGAYTIREVGGVCMILGDGAVYEMANVFWEGNGNTAVGIQMHQTAILDILSGCTFGNFNTGSHVSTDGAGWTLNVDAGYTISNAGNARSHMQGLGAGVINVSGSITITTNGGPAPAMTDWYVLQGAVLFNLGGGITFTGGPQTGATQWQVNQQAWLSRGGNTIPGSVTGNPPAGSNPTSGTGWVS
jgi:hypothetical protein